MSVHDIARLSRAGSLTACADLPPADPRTDNTPRSSATASGDRSINSALAVRLLGRDVELTCACGLVLIQAMRMAISERCPDPKCGRRWR
jgi:hypothetical protein